MLFIIIIVIYVLTLGSSSRIHIIYVKSISIWWKSEQEFGA